MLKKITLLFSLLLLVGAPAMAETKVTPIKPLGINVDHGINLTLERPATSVFIANPEIADVQVLSPTSIMIFGKRTGETSFIATDSSGHPLEQRTVVVTQDLSNLRRELDIAIPHNKIRAAALPNGLVLMGEAKDAATIADAYKMAQRYIPAGGDIINRIHVVGSNQIHIRVRFAEVSKKVDNTFGIDWASAANVGGGFMFGLASGAAFGMTNGMISTRPNNTSLTLPNDGLGLSHQGGLFNINGLIDALAQDGLVTILAEPNLTAMSGETASFLAGGEIPVPIPQGGSGSNLIITVEWKKYGISLQFTPTLISENRISLHVKPEVSQLSTAGQIVVDGITIPGLLTRKAETTVEVGSGQSFAIAGLLDNQQAETVNKFPLLGNLFRSSQFKNNQSELVVIITPYIVTPTGEQQMALPTDGISPPTEADRLWSQRMNASDPSARPVSGLPTAVREVEPAKLAEEKVPDAAPVAPVTTNSSPAPLALPASNSHAAEAPKPSAALVTEPSPTPINLTNINKVVPGHLSPEEAAPSGPGGFILE